MSAPGEGSTYIGAPIITIIFNRVWSVLTRREATEISRRRSPGPDALLRSRVRGGLLPAQRHQCGAGAMQAAFHRSDRQAKPGGDIRHLALLPQYLHIARRQLRKQGFILFRQGKNRCRRCRPEGRAVSVSRGWWGMLFVSAMAIKPAKLTQVSFSVLWNIEKMAAGSYRTSEVPAGKAVISAKFTAADQCVRTKSNMSR